MTGIPSLKLCQPIHFGGIPLSKWKVKRILGTERLNGCLGDCFTSQCLSMLRSRAVSRGGRLRRRSRGQRKRVSLMPEKQKNYFASHYNFLKTPHELQHQPLLHARMRQVNFPTRRNVSSSPNSTHGASTYNVRPGTRRSDASITRASSPSEAYRFLTEATLESVDSQRAKSCRNHPREVTA